MMKDVRVPVLTATGTEICCNNWHWIGTPYQNPNVLSLTSYDRVFLTGVMIRVDD